jgi:hypothetical protein
MVERASSPPSEVAGPSFRGRHVNGSLIFVHTKEQPTDSEWDQLCEFYRKFKTDRVLVFSEGGAPNTVQRSKLNQVMDNNPRVAIMTPSLLVRSVGTALRWFHDRIRVFGPAEIESALGHLALSDDQAQVVRRSLDELRTDLRKSADGGRAGTGSQRPVEKSTGGAR